MKVHILTAEGKEVAPILAIPDFNMAPEVIFWGTRSFIRAGIGLQGEYQYKEAFSYSLPDVLDSAKASNLDSDGA